MSPDWMSQILHVAFHYLSKNSDFTGCPVVYLVNADLSPDQRKLCVCISIYHRLLAQKTMLFFLVERFQDEPTY